MCASLAQQDPTETIRGPSHPGFNYLLYSDQRIGSLTQKCIGYTTEKWKATKGKERVNNVMKGYRGSLSGMVKPGQVRTTEDCKKKREVMEGQVGQR